MYTVILCAKICYDLRTSKNITEKETINQILNPYEKSLVKGH